MRSCLSFGPVNRKLEQDVEQKKRLLAERKELVDNLSHEMKTPLGVIRAYAEGLQDETDEGKIQRFRTGACDCGAGSFHAAFSVWRGKPSGRGGILFFHSYNRIKEMILLSKFYCQMKINLRERLWLLKSNRGLFHL